jgi:hypothetical protein
MYQRRWADSISLKAIAKAAAVYPSPLVTFVRSPTVTNVGVSFRLATVKVSRVLSRQGRYRPLLPDEGSGTPRLTVLTLDPPPA